MLCDNQKKAETLLQNREKGETPVLKMIIIMDSFSPELIERGAKCGVEIMSLEDIEVIHSTYEESCSHELFYIFLSSDLGEEESSKANCKSKIKCLFSLRHNMLYLSLILLSQQPPKPEDLSVICFTSGTTGD